MKRLVSAVLVELLKISRSKIFWLTILVGLIIPVMCGFMMWIVKNPELATNLNLVKAKADILIAKADWPSFFKILFMIVAVAGIIIFGFIVSWIFGREYTDHTIKDILALPVSRTMIVLSKFIAVIFWCFLLSIIIFLTGVISGFIVDLPSWSMAIVLSSLKTFLVAASLTIMLSFPVGFFASSGRGYLSPLGFVIFMIALAQFMAHLGWGAYFPWSIPALYTGAAGPEEAQLGFISFFIIIMTGLIGLVATVIWWRWADQK